MWTRILVHVYMYLYMYTCTCILVYTGSSIESFLVTRLRGPATSCIEFPAEPDHMITYIVVQCCVWEKSFI